ncbi:glutamine amidotransferase [Burkholderiales bacterium]|nr:glutamine amidotransferase [Burkholderiales bacterium]
MITIIDYGMGNLGSIRNMLKRVGQESEVTCDPQHVARATKLILPGVGSFDAGMANLRADGMAEVLDERVLYSRIPILGICLGMQLMTHRSDEGVADGLGWVDAEVLKFRPSDAAPKIPHMGWNLVKPVRQSPLLQDLPDEARFYFVHSFHVRCLQPDDVLLTTSYGAPFHSGFEHNNIWGVQFHPEKSHKFGMQLLRNFAQRCGPC